MNKRTWIILFVLALICDIIAGLANNHAVEYIAKPLIIPSLIGYFSYKTGATVSPLKKWIFLALLFSWAGDVLLMFQDKDQLYFLLGLSSFLIAHIFYIVFFHRVRIIENIKGRIWIVLAVAIYYLALVTLLSPYLGDMRLPVRIYGIVISLMLMLAGHMLFISNRRAGQWMIMGALLFVVSDSTLAVNKFYQSFEGASIMIMLTYGLAQLFIAEGTGRYICFSSKE